METKLELQRQNQKLMKIDESLNRIDGTTQRIKRMTGRLKKGLVADKIHLFCVGCICLNFVIFIGLLISTFGQESPTQQIHIYNSSPCLFSQ